MGNMLIGSHPEEKIPAAAEGATGSKGPEKARYPQAIGAKSVTAGKGKLAERISFFHEQIERVTPKAKRSISPGPTRGASPQLGQGPSVPSTPSVQKRPLPSPQKAVEETVQEGKKQKVVVHERVASIEAKLVGEEVRPRAAPQKPPSSVAIGPRTAEYKAKLEEARAKLRPRLPGAPPVLVPAGTTAKELLEAQRKRSAENMAKMGQHRAPEEQRSVAEETSPASPAEQSEGSTEAATPPPPPPLPSSLGVAGKGAWKMNPQAVDRGPEEAPSVATGSESTSIPPPSDSADRTAGSPDSSNQVREEPLKKSDDSRSALLRAIQRESGHLKKASERVLSDKPKGTTGQLNVAEVLANRIGTTVDKVPDSAGVEDDASDWGDEDSEIQETAQRVSKDISKCEETAERGLEGVRSRKEAFEAARAVINDRKRPDGNEAQKKIVKQRAAAAAKARDAVKDADEAKIAADKAKVVADAAAAKAKDAAGIADEASRQPGLQPSARAELAHKAKDAAAAYAVAAKAAGTAAFAVTDAADKLKKAGEESERLTTLANTPLTSDEIKLAPVMVMKATVDREFENARNALDAAVHLADEAKVAARSASDSLDSVVKGGDATLTQQARDAAEAAKKAADEAQDVVDGMTQALEGVKELRQEVTNAVYDERRALIGEEKPAGRSGENLRTVLSGELEKKFMHVSGDRSSLS